MIRWHCNFSSMLNIVVTHPSSLHVTNARTVGTMVIINLTSPPIANAAILVLPTIGILVLPITDIMTSACVISIMITVNTVNP